MQKSEAMQTSGDLAGAVRGMCRLSDDQLTTRLAEIRRDILPHIRKTHNLEDGLVLDFNDTPNLKTKFERLGALEQECCAGLRFEFQRYLAILVVQFQEQLRQKPRILMRHII